MPRYRDTGLTIRENRPVTGDPRDATLDGLRGAAALAVVYVHYLFFTGLSARPGGGHVGVLIFFVLSGYLITRGVWSRPSPSAGTYVRFLRRRVQRLYPPLLGVVAVCTPLMVAFGPEDARQAATASVMVLTQLVAFAEATGVLPAPGWQHTWSLTVEWLFYVLWPVVLLGLRRRGTNAESARRVALTCAGILYLASLPLSPRDFYLLPVANLGVMLCGAALALAHTQRGSGRYAGKDAGLADLAFVLFLVMVFLPSVSTGTWLHRVTFFPAAVLSAWFVIDQRPASGGLARRVLASRPLAAVGLASYSLYLWHLPVLWIIWWGLPAISPVGRAATALAVLAPLVYLSFRYLEVPWLRHSQTRRHSESGTATVRAKAVES